MSDLTYIDRTIKLIGVLKSPGHMVVIAGHFEGEIEAGDIQILAGGVCQGMVNVKSATISGLFNGILECDVMNVTDDAVVMGEITTEALSVDSGADISGIVTRKPIKDKTG